ncbi:hypothetical protein [Staphylococcus debuckii]|uniref:hypothetical protein n=1 Tax=Staphylococcus debuckii TaxID=2044912 RepID=UPI000F43157D|nr:hypothetical protein [Staphylococcus debuckii]AYU54659.1 hypothetical protein CNQ82_04140 [Staphylococcus debuckii]
MAIVYYNDRPFTLSEEKVKHAHNIGLNMITIQYRLDEGWGLDDAISLSPEYVMKNSVICAAFILPEVSYYLPLETLEDNAIKSLTAFRKRIENNKSIDGLLKENNLYFVDRNSRTEYDLALEDVMRRKRAEERSRERKKAEKPWLYDGTPQCVKPSKWYKHLAENDIFIKVVQ